MSLKCIQLSQNGHLWRIHFLGKNLILPNSGHKVLHKHTPPPLPLMEKNATEEHFSCAQQAPTAAAFSASRFENVKGSEATPWFHSPWKANKQGRHTSFLKNMFLYHSTLRPFLKQMSQTDFCLITLLLYTLKFHFGLVLWEEHPTESVSTLQQLCLPP